MQNRMISLVIPVFNEEKSLYALNKGLIAVLNKLDRPYELIYVDDGSRDSSFSILEKFARKDLRVKVIRFTRNYGQTAAMTAGIEEAMGEVIVMLDADLQNDPTDIPVLLSKIEEGYDIASGWRYKRKDAWSRRFLSNIANKLISYVTGVHLHDYGCSLKAYRSEVIKKVRLYGEMHRFIPALVSMNGATIIEVKVGHHKRETGKSKYGLERIGKVLLDLLTVKFLLSYSTKPIYFFGLWGGLLFFCSGIMFLLMLLFSVVRAGVISGIFMIAGFQFIFMGLICEILVRIYHESQGKPTYLSRERLNLSEDKSHTDNSTV